jgi:hypothetical protein
MHWADTITTASLCTVIALAPLPFGSTDLKVIAVWVLLLSAVAALASLQRLGSRDVVFLLCFAVIAVSWGFVVVEQITRAPIFADQLTNPIWQQTSDIIGHELPATITVASHQPYFSAGSQIACMLSMVCGFLVGRNRRAAYLLLLTFAGSGLAYAIYGILAFILWPDHLLWMAKFSYRNSLVGTFFNPNVAAVYFGACAVVWLLLLGREISNIRGMRDRRGTSSFWRADRSKVWLGRLVRCRALECLPFHAQDHNG